MNFLCFLLITLWTEGVGAALLEVVAELRVPANGTAFGKLLKQRPVFLMQFKDSIFYVKDCVVKVADLFLQCGVARLLRNVPHRLGRGKDVVDQGCDGENGWWDDRVHDVDDCTG